MSYRTLQDIGKSGHWMLFPCVLFFAFAVVMVFNWYTAAAILGILVSLFSIMIFVWFISDSTPGDNKYGPNPKEASLKKAFVSETID